MCYSRGTKEIGAVKLCQTRRTHLTEKGGNESFQVVHRMFVGEVLRSDLECEINCESTVEEVLRRDVEKGRDKETSMHYTIRRHTGVMSRTCRDTINSTRT